MTPRGGGARYRNEANNTNRRMEVLLRWRFWRPDRIACQQGLSSHGNEGSVPPSNRQQKPWSQLLISFVTGNFLPIALASALCLGLLRPELGATAAKSQLQTSVVIAIFIVSGLQLKRGEALQVGTGAGT